MTRLNNFDALRLSAAFLVLYSHQYALNGLPEPRAFGLITLGTLGVMIFFSISGFLVSQSWRLDPHAGRFLAKRFLRIWPGLAAFTLIAALVLGPIVTTLPLRDYVQGPDFSAFFANLRLLSIRFNLPGVFESNVFPRAVNGSLWTIPIEVRCYLILMLLGILGLAKQPLLALLGTAIFGVYYFAFAYDPRNYQFHYGLFFFTGVCLDLLRKHWEYKIVESAAAIAAVAGMLYLINAPQAVLLLLVATFSVIMGSRSTPILNRFGKFGDLSYGIYVYAFAVQQTVLWALGKDYPFVPGLLISAAITTACAYLSWHLIESPALGLKTRLLKDGKRLTL